MRNRLSVGQPVGMESLPSVQDSDIPFEKGNVMEYLESISDENGGILLPKKVGLFIGTK